MMQRQIRRVSDYLRPVTGVVRATDPLYRVRKYARSGRYRSIIVTQDNKPVGLIRWPEIDRANVPEWSLARDLMLANSPTLTTRMSVREAITSLKITQTDRLPVVDRNGDLVGVFVQETTKDAVDMDVTDGPQPSGSPEHETQERQAFTVYPGMEVYSSGGTLLGLVDRLFLEAGVASGFLVAYGPDQTLHKLLDIDAVESMLDETITLSVSDEGFVNLPDVDPDFA